MIRNLFVNQALTLFRFNSATFSHWTHGLLPWYTAPVIIALIIFIITYAFIGSVANLIVVQQAGEKIEIRFMEYLRIGALITAATIAIGILTLAVEVHIAHGTEAVAAGEPTQQMMVNIVPADPSAGPQAFRVARLCDTPDAMTQGLQGFRQLMPDEAALFVFDKPEAVTFWMGNVAFPIDIIFINSDKKVMRVYRSCKPGSKDLYPSVKPAKWALEIAAGSRIKAGDRVSFK